jgi:hypothetical protein
MKQYIKYLSAIIATALLVGGCASTSNSDEYFGYNNNPKTIETNSSNTNKAEVAQVKSKDDWVNPFSEQYSEQTGGENITIVNQYMYPSYVPVVVPWWDRYYGYYSRPHSGIYFSYSYYPRNYYGWDWYWYSPYYDYHPYYGYNVARSPWWYDHYWWGGYVGYSGYTSAKDPNKVKKEKSYRNFGPSRGGVYDPTSRGSSTSVGSNTRGSTRGSNYATPSSGTNANSPDKVTNVEPSSTLIRSSSRTSSATTKYLPNKGESSRSSSTGTTFNPTNSGVRPSSTGTKYTSPRNTKSSGSTYSPGTSTGSSSSSGTSVRSGSSRSSGSSGSSGTSVGSGSSSGGSSKSSGSSSGSSRGSRRK